MNKILIISLMFSLIGCKSSQKSNTETNGNTIEKPTEKIMKTEEPKPIAVDFLTGEKTVTDLQQSPYNIWFTPGFDTYTPNPATITALKKVTSDVTLKIFMGTWCEDSQNQVPRFYKILQQLDFNLKKVQLITVDRSKKTPENLEAGLNITNVPTFIFYKKNVEIQRIVESPVETLEDDMLKILSNQEYKHTYEK